MALLWFILGLVIIFLISRYNESNKLFWILFASFVGAFTVASIVKQVTVNDGQSKANLTQMCPMQAPTSVLSILPVTDTSCKVTEVAPTTVLAGQDYTFVPREIAFAENEDGVVIFDKPPQIRGS